MGEPHHVGSTFGSLLTGCLPTNLLTHSSGRLHMCFPLNCCQRQKVRSTCYQANYTIYSPKISFGTWLHCFHVDYHRTTYAHFVNYLTVWDVLLSSGKNPYVEEGPLVPDVVLCDHKKDVNFPHVEFTTPVYVTHRCERQFCEWTVVDFSEPSQECSLVC